MVFVHVETKLRELHMHLLLELLNVGLNIVLSLEFARDEFEFR